MKTAFITGAAQGIGLAIARRFAREGYQVGLFDTNVERCQALLSEPDFQNAVAGYCDVRDSASIEEAIAIFSQATSGRLDVLVNNAGVFDPPQERSASGYDTTWAVNVLAPFKLTRLLLPLLASLSPSQILYSNPLVSANPKTKFMTWIA